MMNADDDIPEAGISDDDIAALYRKAEDATPPASLDQSILAAARNAFADEAGTRKPGRSPFSGRWPVAVSLAAVIVVAILLVPLIEHQAPSTESAPPSAMDDRYNKVEPAEAKKAVRERLPESSPGYLYAPAPALEESVRDEGDASTISRSGAAAPATAPESQSRAQARLNAAGGSPLAIFTPEMWLAKIQQLIDSGKIREASDELDRFRQAHPDYVLDQNLLERLKQP
jgi:hypothetical protein